MAFDIVLGRSDKDVGIFGKRGAILLAKQYVKMGQTTSLSNNMYLDVAGSHVIFVCGKRGEGKSYTMGVIAEGMTELPEDVSQNLSIIMLDTMGVYWTMKFPNHKEEQLLREWGLQGKGLNVIIYTPADFYHKYKAQGIPTDFPFSIRPSELSAMDWAMTFGISLNDPLGVVLERTVDALKEAGDNYGIEEIITHIRNEKSAEQHVKYAVENHFLNTRGWGLFAKEGTSIAELTHPGQITVLDMSCYATLPNGWAIKSIVIGIVAQKLFTQRMLARKNEEYEQVHTAEHYFGTGQAEKKLAMPLVWLIIDEAHEFLPKEGRTPATDSLITILREGRQPGISLVLATQQPGKIHTDVMTQSDIVISHRVTAKIDTDALGMLMQSYLREGIDRQLSILPREKGAALIVDDNNERMYSVRIRPRSTWHGGASPMAISEKKALFEKL